jgi:serine/threonine protein kinase
MPSARTSHHDDAPRRLEPGAQVERYIVDELIGDGGTASVYRVHHAELGTPYALKVLNLLSPGIRRRTLQEGRVQARLNHRNIVAVYDTFEVDGAPGLLMELIDGPSLDTALQRVRLKLDQAEVLFRAILEGVRQAHNFGLVHRDLKPANVLLARTNSGLVPKVTDFGIAKMTETENVGHTRAGVAMGTPQYMAPEQIRDARSVDRRADIFSLGCILYELVTGQRAFPDDDIVRVYNAVCDGQYTPALELAPDLPPRIDEAIRGCLAVDRDRRIPDCGVLLEVLEGTRRWTGQLPAATAVPITGVPDLEVGGPGPETSAATYLPMDLLGESDDRTAEVRPPTLAEVSALPADADAAPAHTTPLSTWIAASAVALLLLVVAVGQLRGAPPSEALAPAVVSTSPTPLAAPPPHPAGPAPAPTTAASQPSPPASAPVAPKATAAAASTPSPTPPVPAVPVPAPPVVPTPKVEPAPVEPTPKVEAAPVVSTGVLRILTSPPTATVWIDGVQQGASPRKIEAVEPGHHQVRVALGDDVGSFLVDVKAGGDTRWCYTFETRAATPGACPR